MGTEEEELYEAAGRNDVATINRLLDPSREGARVDVHWHNPDWVAALERAAGTVPKEPVLRFIVSLDQDGRQKNQWTALHNAAFHGHVQALHALLAGGADVDVQTPDGEGDSFGWAAANGQVDAMRTLLEAGADIHAQTKDGETALHVAAAYGMLEAVRLLLNVGADAGTTKKDLGNRTPLGYTGWLNSAGKAQRADLPAIQELLKAAMPRQSTGKKEKDLYAAAARNDVAGIRRLLRSTALSRGAYINWRNPDSDGRTPLHVAAGSGYTESVRALLQMGAHVRERSLDGMMPLHDAAMRAHVDVVQALLAAGADVRDTVNRRTPLDMAGTWEHIPSHKKAAVPALQELLKAAEQRYNLVNKQAPSATATAAAALEPAPTQAVPPAPPAAPAPAPAPSPIAMLPALAAAPAPAPAPAADSADTGLTLYTGGAIILPSQVSSQTQGALAALVDGGMDVAVQVVGGIATCNPCALALVPLLLLRAVRTATQQDSYCRERLLRVVARVSAMEPALSQLSADLKPPLLIHAQAPVVQSLCMSLIMLVQVLAALQDLQRKLQSKGPGVLQRTLQLLKAGGHREALDALEMELRDCLSQLSTVLNISHFSQAAQGLRSREELQVAAWQQQNEADWARDLQQLESLVMEAVGGVQVLQQQLAEQRVVLDDQVVGLQHVAEWLQHMHAGNAVVVGHLQQMGQQLDGLGKQMGVLHMDVTSVKDQVAQLVDIMVPRRQQRQKRTPLEYLPDLALSRERIELADDLDEALADAKRGAFGGVVEAEWEGHPVAVKVYNYKGLDRGDCKEAAREAVLLSKANHPNIVRCFGVVYDPDTAARDCIHGSLVMEWVAGGTLSSWLQEEEQEDLPLRGRLLLAQRVAAGMRHLHEKKLVHGDLKPQNILVTDLQPARGDIVPQVKICDFGLAKYTSSSLHPTRQVTQSFTLAYTSPERAGTFLPSAQDDVYAFGILMYAIASASTPFSGIRPEHVLAAVQRGVRPSFDQWLDDLGGNGAEREVAEMYSELAKQCWQQEPDLRPTFQLVHDQLGTMLVRMGV